MFRLRWPSTGLSMCFRSSASCHIRALPNDCKARIQTRPESYVYDYFQATFKIAYQKLRLIDDRYIHWHVKGITRTAAEIAFGILSRVACAHVLLYFVSFYATDIWLKVGALKRASRGEATLRPQDYPGASLADFQWGGDFGDRLDS